MRFWQPGRKVRIESDQLSILKRYFDINPNWSFEKKLEIG